MAETKKADVPGQFQNMYRMDNLEGVKRLLAHKFGEEAVKKFRTIDIFQIILTLTDETCPLLRADSKEMERRLDALEEGTIKEDGKTRTPMDKYYAVTSGLEHSAVYCAEDKKTGKLIADPLSSENPAPVAYIALSKKIEAARYKGVGNIIELEMDDFILRCADEGIEGFIVDRGDKTDPFAVEEYEEDAVEFMSARKVVNTILGEGISGDLLFPALSTYMHDMLVDIKKKDGTVFTGYFVSLMDNECSTFMVMDENGEESVHCEQEELEWLRVHMSDDEEE
ncbi:MAG: hypothetical protein LUD50_05755 [Clostridia bacterium]|nr:hypothetical protein [Clostridia bacterium]